VAMRPGQFRYPREGDRPPLEAGIRGLAEGEQPEKTQCVCSEMSSVKNRVRL
jgi:hypothetical protein